VVGGWRRLHNEELHNLYTLPNVIKVIKSRRIWAGHVACLGETSHNTIFRLENLKGKEHLGRWEDIRIDITNI
jgi:hypothetical protein